MALSPHTVTHCHKLLDALVAYATRRLTVVAVNDDLTFSTRVTSHAQDPREALWSNLDILRTYVRTNPDGLDQDDRALVASWEHAYVSDFFVMADDTGTTSLLSCNHAFRVEGLPADALGRIGTPPVLVHTVLLPIRDAILCGPFLHAGAVAGTEDEVVRRARRMHVACVDTLETGSALIAVAPRLRRRTIDAIIDAIQDDPSTRVIDREVIDGARSTLEALYDAVGGALAHLFDDFSVYGRRAWNMAFGALDACANRGPVVETYRALLTGDETRRSIETCDLITDLDALQERVNHLSATNIRFTETLVEHCGRIRPELCCLAQGPDVPTPVPGLFDIYSHKGRFLAVMYAELRPQSLAINWHEARAANQRDARFSRYFDAVVELRGVAVLDEAVAEYRKLASDVHDDLPDIASALATLVHMRGTTAHIIESEGRSYLVHPQLFRSWQRWRSVFDPKPTARAAGRLDERIARLLERHKMFRPRPVSPDMLGDGGISSWRMLLPSAIALRALLRKRLEIANSDEAIDNVIDTLSSYARCGVCGEFTDIAAEYFEALGLPLFGTEDEDVRQKWKVFCDELPTWWNNGWSVDELYGRQRSEDWQPTESRPLDTASKAPAHRTPPHASKSSRTRSMSASITMERPRISGGAYASPKFTQA